MTLISRKGTRLGSWGIVGVIILALVAWMASGLLGGAKHSAQAVEQPAPAPLKRFTVSVREQLAQTIRREVLINGETHPDQVVNIASQAEGQVIAVGPRKGARVAEGDLLAKIHPQEWAQHRVKAEALVRQRELEYGAALKLRESGHVTEADLASRLGLLELARAELKDIELRLEALTIKAPVSGIIEDRKVEVGDYVKIGQSVVQLIKIDPLIVSGGVNEADIAHVEPGAAASAQILGRRVEGRVRFVSSMADSSTRTFTVEVAVDNAGGRIPAGLSARVSIPVTTASAQRLPASLLSLADDGTVGVKHVVDGRVVFTRAEIVRAEGDALYVGGLPERILLITRGQGFVMAGEAVEVAREPTATAQAVEPAAQAMEPAAQAVEPAAQ